MREPGGSECLPDAAVGVVADGQRKEVGREGGVSGERCLLGKCIGSDGVGWC
jgi:hypothetical protein